MWVLRGLQLFCALYRGNGGNHDTAIGCGETERGVNEAEAPGADFLDHSLWANSLISLVVHWNKTSLCEQWAACRGNGLKSQTSLGWNPDPNRYQFSSLGKFSLSLSHSFFISKVGIIKCCKWNKNVLKTYRHSENDHYFSCLLHV